MNLPVSSEAVATAPSSGRAVSSEEKLRYIEELFHAPSATRTALLDQWDLTEATVVEWVNAIEQIEVDAGRLCTAHLRGRPEASIARVRGEIARKARDVAMSGRDESKNKSRLEPLTPEERSEAAALQTFIERYVLDRGFHYEAPLKRACVRLYSLLKRQGTSFYQVFCRYGVTSANVLYWRGTYDGSTPLVVESLIAEIEELRSKREQPASSRWAGRLQRKMQATQSMRENPPAEQIAVSPEKPNVQVRNGRYFQTQRKQSSSQPSTDDHVLPEHPLHADPPSMVDAATVSEEGPPTIVRASSPGPSADTVVVREAATPVVEASGAKQRTRKISKGEALIRAQQVLEKVCLVISGDDAMEEIWYEIERAARSDGQVLLRGETGTGKELFFLAIHELRNGNNAWHAINCAALTESLSESELFGHVKGAFTNAITDRHGAFKVVADGGTLLLDEIGDMPMIQQAKLLRVLESRTFAPVGSDQTVSLHDTKIVAATNQDLERKIREGTFRKDLYYRLAGNEIRIPPLRQRSKEHVRRLIDHFLRQFSKGRGVTLSADALSRILALAVDSKEYEGNVRELREHLKRSCEEAEREQATESCIQIGEAHVQSTLLKRLTGSHDVHGSTISLFNNALRVNISSDGSIMSAQIELDRIAANSRDIHDALEAILTHASVLFHGGNQSAAASHLGASRCYMREKERLFKLLQTYKDENATDQ